MLEPSLGTSKGAENTESCCISRIAGGGPRGAGTWLGLS